MPAMSETLPVVDQKIELIGRFAGTLSLIEIALGSVLHSFRVPLAGNFLALNQGYLLCRASLQAAAFGAGSQAPHIISNSAAVLKSLSPAGKKLGPMLSLSAQGFLFTAGVRLFGVNLVGLIVGMVLLSTWTFLQPLITYYVFFGDQLFTAFDYFQKTLPFVKNSLTILAIIFAVVVIVKVLLAIGLAILAWRTQGQALFQDRLLAQAKNYSSLTPRRVTNGSPVILALRDLLNPLFVISLATTTTFFFFVESSWSQVIWMSLRPVAIAFVFFYISRKINLRRFLRSRESELARVTERALEEIEKPRS